MFNKSLLAIVIAGLISAPAFAEDWKKTQMNMSVKTDDWGIEHRQHINDDNTHIELQKYVDNMEFAYRYVQDGGDANEHRVKFTITALDTAFVYVKPRIEYRMMESSDNNWRVRPTVGLKYDLTPNDKVYVETTPMWHLGKGKKDDFKMDESQNNIGVKHKFNEHVALNTFIRHETDKDWKKTNQFLGTNLEFKF